MLEFLITSTMFDSVHLNCALSLIYKCIKPFVTAHFVYRNQLKSNRMHAMKSERKTTMIFAARKSRSIASYCTKALPCNHVDYRLSVELYNTAMTVSAA